MKYKILSALIIIAITSGLCVIALISASAAGPTSVQTLTVEPSPDTADQLAAYTISFTTSSSGTLMAGIGIINITFSPETQLPSSINMANVSIDGTICSSGTLSGNTLIIVAPETIEAEATCSVTINITAGIVNPQLSQETGDSAPDNLYETSVTTSADAIAATDDYEIFDWIETEKTALKTAFSDGELVIVIGAGFNPGSMVTLNGMSGGPLAGSGTVESDGTFEIYGFATGVLMEDLEASDGSGRIASIPADQFTIVPQLTITPDNGPVCTDIQLSGYNWAGTPNAIAIAGQAWAFGAITMVDRDNDGNDDDFILTMATDDSPDPGQIAQIPRNLASGPVDIVVSGTFTNSVAAQTTFTIDSRVVTVDPASGPPGTMVTIQGSGFCPGETFGKAVLMYGNTTATGIITQTPIEVTDSGNFIAMGTIPEDAAPGLHGVIVYFDPSSPSVYDPTTGTCLQAQGMFTVTDRELTVVPNSGPFGTTITMSGGNFGMEAAGLLPDLYINDEDVAPELDPLTTSGQVIPETFTITPERNFHYGDDNLIEVRVYVDGSGTLTANALFEVIRPTLCLDRDQGPRGTLVTVEGDGWLPGDTSFVTIEYAGVPGRGVYGDTVAVAPPDANGDIWAQFSIPWFSGTIMAEGDLNLLFSAIDNNQNASLQSVFTVTVPTFELDSDRGPRGTLVTATGSGWPPEADNFVSIGYAEVLDRGVDADTVAVVQPDGNGDIWAQLTIPAFTPDVMLLGDLNLLFSAHDSIGNTSPESVFTVIVPQISVEPESAAPGESITVTGIGFMPLSQVQEVSLADAQIAPVWEFPLTDSIGSFEVEGTVPGATPGGYVAKARVTEDEGSAITCPFVVLVGFDPGTPSGPAQITVSPQSGFAGEAVTVKGTNFMPLAYVQEVLIADAPIVPVYELPVTSGTGSFEVIGTIPGIMPGTQMVAARVTQSEAEEVTCPFVVMGDFTPGTPTGVAQITVEPESAPAGETFIVKGINFAPLAQVQEISIANALVVPLWELPITSGTGAFEVVGTVPGVMPGGYVIKVRVTQDEGDEIICPFMVLIGSSGDITVEQGFAAIDGLYTTVWTFDKNTKGWLVYKAGLPPWISIFFNTLNKGQGYWVNVTEDCTIVYSAHTYELVTGWNLFGWLG